MSATMSSTALPKSFVLSVEGMLEREDLSVLFHESDGLFAQRFVELVRTLPSTAGMGRRLNSDAMTGDLGSKYVRCVAVDIAGKEA